MKVVSILFFVLLALFPLGQVGRVDLGGGVAILFNDVAVFLVVASWVVHKLRSKQSFHAYPLTIPIALFTGACVLSLLFNLGKFSFGEVAVGSLYLVRWVIYAGLYFVVSDLPKKVQVQIPFWLLGIGTTVALLGFIQYFFYPDLRNLYYAGWDEHLYRLFSTFLDPNFAGGIFILTFLLGVGVLGKLGRSGRLGIIVAIVSFVALLLTYSRGSFVSFFVGVITFFWLSGKKRFFVPLVGLFAIGVFLLPKDSQSEGVKFLRTASIDARLESLQKGWIIFQDNPVFGIGFNTYRYVQERYGFIKPTVAVYDRASAGTDNSFLFVLVTSGVVGFLAYLYVWGRVIGEIREIGDSGGRALLFSSFAAVFVHALFVNSLFYPYIMEWLWVLLAVSRARTLS